MIQMWLNTAILNWLLTIHISRSIKLAMEGMRIRTGLTYCMDAGRSEPCTATHA